MKLIAIESLNDDDVLKTGASLVKNYAGNEKLEALLFECNTKAEFISNLLDIINNTNSNDEIILSLETHGSVIGLELKSKEILTWFELAPLLQEINEKSHMGLILLASACWGGYFFQAVTLSGRSPYYKFLGPNDGIHPSKIYQMNVATINALLENRDVDLVVKNKNKYFIHADVQYVYFDAGDLFRSAFTKYLKESLEPMEIARRTASHYNEFFLRSLRTRQPIEKFQRSYILGLLDKSGIETSFYKQMDRFLMTDIDKSLYEKFPMTFDECWDESGIESIYDKWMKENGIVP